MTRIEIKNRWTDAILFSHEQDGNTMAITLKLAIAAGSNLSGSNLSGSDLRGSNLRGSNLSDSNLSGSDLSGSDLRGSNLSGSNLSGSNLSGSNLSDSDLSGSNLSGSNLTPIRDDIWAVLSAAPSEVAGLIQALKEGRVNGSQYSGSCACLVGTIANIRGVGYTHLGALKPAADRPAERFFIAIRQGDTPATSQFSALAVEWAEQWLDMQRAAFDPSYVRPVPALEILADADSRN